MSSRSENILSRWQGTVSGTNCSPLRFLDLVEDRISAASFEGLVFTRIVRREAGYGSPSRVYLRVRSGRIYFDISAFVLAGDLIVGYWLHLDPEEMRSLFSEIPIIGWVLRNARRTSAYYPVDRAEAVQRAIHESVLSVVNFLSNEPVVHEQGTEPSAPVWRDLVR